MRHVFSCRLSVYGDHQEAFSLLPQAGIRHLEVGVPNGFDFSSVQNQAKAHGLALATVATGLSLDPVQEMEAFFPLLDAVAKIGVPKIFVSVKGSDTVSRVEILTRLRRVAEKAQTLGLTLCMETHPPFGTNGDVARRTIEDVGNEALRYNFDTANVYYYNQGTDAVSELKKVAPYVSSVHLKDTDGGYHSSNFPVLGQGVVDFPTVFAILDDTGFEGPYTLELEGPLTEGKTLNEIQGAVMGSMAHLKAIGVA